MVISWGRASKLLSFLITKSTYSNIPKHPRYLSMRFFIREATATYFMSNTIMSKGEPKSSPTSIFYFPYMYSKTILFKGVLIIFMFTIEYTIRLLQVIDS